MDDFISLVYPKVCIHCENSLNKHEYFLCLFCQDDLPLTGFFNLRENPVEMIFKGRVKIEFAGSLLRFESGNKTRNILHHLKYKNSPEIGVHFGRLMAGELLKSSNFKMPDNIVPVPLHKSKLKNRGYNQSACLGMGLSEVLNIPMKEDIIFRDKKTSTQTKKNRRERWENVESVFRVNSEAIKDNDYILLVDDVVTTGATIEACIRSMRNKADIRTGVVSLAYTD